MLLETSFDASSGILPEVSGFSLVFLISHTLAQATWPGFIRHRPKSNPPNDLIFYCVTFLLFSNWLFFKFLRNVGNIVNLLMAGTIVTTYPLWNNKMPTYWGTKGQHVFKELKPYVSKHLQIFRNNHIHWSKNVWQLAPVSPSIFTCNSIYMVFDEIYEGKITKILKYIKYAHDVIFKKKSQ